MTSTAARGDRPAGHARRRLRTWLAVAVVVLVAYAAQAWLGDGDSGRPAGDPALLFGSGLALLHPRGEVDAYPPFDWKIDLPPGGFFVVRVRDRSGEGFERVSPHLERAPWTPADVPAWPAAIRWSVEVHPGDGGDALGIFGATASLSTP